MMMAAIRTRRAKPAEIVSAVRGHEVTRTAFTRRADRSALSVVGALVVGVAFDAHVVLGHGSRARRRPRRAGAGRRVGSAPRSPANSTLPESVITVPRLGDPHGDPASRATKRVARRAPSVGRLGAILRSMLDRDRACAMSALCCAVSSTTNRDLAGLRDELPPRPSRVPPRRAPSRALARGLAPRALPY